MATVTCPQCGTANPAGSKFCDGCGINLTQQLHTTSTTLGVSGSAAPPPSGTPGSARTTAPSPTPAQTYAPGARLLPGQTLAEHMVIGDGGRYAIDRPLGKGGMGSIFLAHDTRVNNKPVVIKQMIPNFTTEAERIEAEQGFQEEMRTLAAMAHPNIPNISDYFSEAGFDFIVQEYVPGEDLQKKLEAAGGKGLPERQVLGWASQILAVLDYLTNLDPQVIHRDIKPANIVVDTNNRVRVVDFGVASHKIRTAAKPSAAAPASSGGQQISAPMGTPGYAPREQFLGQETPLSDLYALGATMHQLLTGRNPQPPVDGPPSFSYPPVRQLAPAVSETTARIVAHALQNDVSKRYQAAAVMKTDVDAILQPKGSLSTAKGKAVALALLLLALLAAGGGAAVYVNNQATLPATGAISTGKVAFDRDIIGRGPSANQPVGSATDPAAWAKAKTDASVQWKDGNISRALALYQQASTNDQTDAESQIYVENAEIVQSGRPYWQVAVGASLTGPALSSGRFALQGAYTAQHEINLGGGVAGRKLVLVLANDASGASGAAEAAKTAAKDGNLLGFIGYSSSSRTRRRAPLYRRCRNPAHRRHGQQPQPEWQLLLLPHLPQRRGAGPAACPLCPDVAAQRIEAPHDRGVPRSQRLVQQRARRDIHPGRGGFRRAAGRELHRAEWRPARHDPRPVPGHRQGLRHETGSDLLRRLCRRCAPARQGPRCPRRSRYARAQRRRLL